MCCTACTEPQCLYKGDLYLHLLHQVVVKCSNILEIHTPAFFGVNKLVSVDFEVASTYDAISPSVTPTLSQKVHSFFSIPSSSPPLVFIIIIIIIIYLSWSWATC